MLNDLLDIPSVRESANLLAIVKLSTFLLNSLIRFDLYSFTCSSVIFISEAISLLGIDSMTVLKFSLVSSNIPIS